MKNLVLVQLVWFLVPLIFLSLNRLEQALGLFFGLLVIFLNLSLFAWLGSSQKLFALKTPIVVLKYAFWAGLIYLILNRTKADTTMFVVGLTSIVLTLLVFALINWRNENSKKEN